MLLTPAGALTLYRFMPLRLALLCGQTVPFASHWPEHLKPFVYGYTPLPCPPPGASIGEALRLHLGQRVRPRSGLRPWDQATYRGWPLYLFAGDRPGTPAGGEVENLFHCVPENVLPLSIGGGDGFGP